MAGPAAKRLHELSCPFALPLPADCEFTVQGLAASLACSYERDHSKDQATPVWPIAKILHNPGTRHQPSAQDGLRLKSGFHDRRCILPAKGGSFKQCPSVNILLMWGRPCSPCCSYLMLALVI